MGDIGNLQIGDIKKKKESLNKSGGINSNKALFQTGNNSESSSAFSPYSSRVEDLANHGTLMQNRFHVQNSNDIALQGKRETVKEPREKQAETKVTSEEDQQIIKAQPDLKVFSGEVMKKGVFTPAAKEAGRHFFMQLTHWAGSFDDRGTGFYGEMGISSVLDCLYVDGMSLRNFVKEQFLYKTSGNPIQDQENLRNYVALLAARGDHVITMVRPTIKGHDEAGVEYRNLDVDLSSVGTEEASKSKKLKEKGKQIRSDLKKRLDPEMTEQTGAAFRRANGISMDGFERIEGASKELKDAGSGESSPEFKAFDESFTHYNSGLQKLGLKPGRDDINGAVANKLLERCDEAIRAADEFLRSGSKDKKAIAAAENAKMQLETDKALLEDAIKKRLFDERNTMSLDEMLDSKKPDAPGKDGKDNNNGDNDNDNDDDNDNNGEDTP